jgi:hypothetical protein
VAGCQQLHGETWFCRGRGLVLYGSGLGFKPGGAWFVSRAGLVLRGGRPSSLSMRRGGDKGGAPVPSLRGFSSSPGAPRRRRSLPPAKPGFPPAELALCSRSGHEGATERVAERECCKLINASPGRDAGCESMSRTVSQGDVHRRGYSRADGRRRQPSGTDSLLAGGAHVGLLGRASSGTRTAAEGRAPPKLPVLRGLAGSTVPRAARSPSGFASAARPS